MNGIGIKLLKLKKIKLVWLTFAVLILYLSMRGIIYALCPVETDEDWAKRDMIMNIPRFICFVAILYIQKFKKLEITINFSAAGVKFVLVTCVLLFILIQLRTLFMYTTALQSSSIEWIVVGSLLVGFFEEGLFRGLFFDIFKTYIGSLFAIFFSTFLFTLFHFQSHTLIDYPALFSIGIMMALMRDRGTSLFMLALLHAAYDSVTIFYLPYEAAPIAWSVFEVFYLLSICLIFSLFTASIRNSH